jgi:aryl-alcohol dehydrogenase
MRTRAAILNQLNVPLTIDEVEVGEPKQGEVLVRMVASGVCHTDVSVMHGILPSPLPVILGHEGAGVVEAVGPGVTKLRKGDHVVTAAVAHCRQCPPCLRGEPFFCAAGLSLAFGGCMPDGTKRFRRGKEEIGHFFLQSSFAQLTVVPEQIAVKVPKDLPLEKLGPLACGIETGSGAVLNVAKVRVGESVAVFGCGGVGLSAVMAARLCKAYPIIAVDMLDSRLAMAKELGATETINAKGTNVVEAIQKLTGAGVDYAFECIGRADTIRQAVDATRVGGTAVISGAVAAGSEVTLDGLGMILKNIKANVEGGSIPDIYIPLLIDLWRKGDFPFDRLLGRTYAHADIAQAIAGMEGGEVVKPVVLYS